ncbi:ICE2-domain-containing protein [Limtongia smithiae]|uniref:ICE2-domain-containing protein n=1 Tax=Limtongia smithiae TaxID=1125753 RepID=UPI0034CF6BCA
MRSLSFWPFFNLFTNAVYLSLIILTIPLAFDVGGKDCGLSFTLTLTVFYFTLATIRLLGRRTKFSTVTHIVYYSQHVIVPSLLILFINIYTESPDCPPGWSRVLAPWRYFLENATPGFTILEGFCTLLVVQAAGQISRWLMARNADLWTILLLMVSASVVTWALYFLHRIYTFPEAMGATDATLVGVALTCTVFLGGYGIASGKGSLTESSLLFGYMVYCVYEMFTDFEPSAAAATTAEAATKPEFPPFPPIIMESYASLAASVAASVPASFATTLEFILAAMSTITPSIAVSLAYRLLVLFASTQIIPAIREGRSLGAAGRGSGGAPGAGTDTDTSAAASSRTSSSTGEEGGAVGMSLVAAYGTCVVIAVYSHLLMEHFGFLPGTTAVMGVGVGTVKLWAWANCFVTLALYASEVGSGQAARSESLTRHWKLE